MKKILLQFADSVLSAKEMKMVMGKDSCSTTCANGDIRSVNCPGQTCFADQYSACCSDLMSCQLCDY